MTPSPTETFWQRNKNKTYPPLTENLNVDVCIIGAGIAGLSVAYQLLNAKKSVIVLESKQIGQGETGNTSAHLSNALDDRYFNIQRMHGKKKTALAAQSHTEAIYWIEQVVKKENIKCNFKRIPGYLFTENKNKSELEKEFSAARCAGLAVEYSEHRHLGKSLLFFEQARFQPQKYLEGLAHSIIELGGKIYENSTVADIDFKNKKIILANQQVVTANYIVTATNAPMFSQLKMHLKLAPQRTYVVCLKIPKNSVEDALYWDTSNPYHYVRLEKYDMNYDVLIVGGEDHRVGSAPKNNPFTRLQGWAVKKFHLEDTEIIYQWSGQVLEPIDYMAYIGRNPKSKTAFMVSGDSGNGLTHGTLAGFLIADLILFGKSPYEKLYHPNRLPIKAIKNLVTNMLASFLNYTKYLLPVGSKMPKFGEGKIIQIGFKKIAAYRDLNGEIKKCSAVCNHLGGLLNWNPIEKTWDCPAHGSRFNIEGDILNGPANTKLTCAGNEKT